MRCVRLLFTSVTLAGLARVAAAQTDSARVAVAAAQAKQKLGLIVYPAKGQTPQQQAQDEQQCYTWAQQQTDPLAKPPNADSAAQGRSARRPRSSQSGSSRTGQGATSESSGR